MKSVVVIFASVCLAVCLAIGVRSRGVSVSGPVLYEAVRKNDVPAAKALIAQGCDVNERAPWGWAPLHQAVYAGPEMVEVLIDSGADVNAVLLGKRANGWTPLFYAVYLGRAEIVELLLKHGATTTAKDVWGKTVFDYAKPRENILGMLKMAHAKEKGKGTNGQQTPKLEGNLYPKIIHP